jgi:hypothetical protein
MENRLSLVSLRAARPFWRSAQQRSQAPPGPTHGRSVARATPLGSQYVTPPTTTLSHPTRCTCMTAASDPHIQGGRIMQSRAEPAPAYRASDASVTTALVSAVKPQQPVYLSHSEHQSAASHTDKPSSSVILCAACPARRSVPDESIAFTKRGQHRSPKASSRRSRSARRAVPPGYLTLTPRRLPHRLLTHHISLIDTGLHSAVSSYRGHERSSPTISTCSRTPSRFQDPLCHTPDARRN